MIPFVSLPIVQVCRRELNAAFHVIVHARQPQWFEVKQVPSVLLGRPLSLGFPDQDVVRMASKRLFKPGRSAAQTCTQIREQFHRKRELKLPLKPGWHLTRGFRCHDASFVVSMPMAAIATGRPKDNASKTL